MKTPPMGNDPVWQRPSSDQIDLWARQAPAGPRPALGPLVVGPPPAMGIPRDSRGDAANSAVEGAGYEVNSGQPIRVSGCARQVCLPNPAGAAWDLVPSALKKGVDRPEASCVCWSDIWFYGGGTVLTLLGLFMLFGGSNASQSPG
jgi:hypothetical protein